MKQPKKLTRRQKEAVAAYHLRPDHWMLVEEMEFYLKIVNKQSGKTRMIDKFQRAKRK